MSETTDDDLLGLRDSGTDRFVMPSNSAIEESSRTIPVADESEGAIVETPKNKKAAAKSQKTDAQPKKPGRPEKSEKVKSKKESSAAGKDKKKRKKATYESYSTYIYRILKQVYPDMGMTAKSMSIMDSLVKDTFMKLIHEVSFLAKRSKKTTLTSRHVEFAAKLVLPGELSKHAVAESLTSSI